MNLLFCLYMALLGTPAVYSNQAAIESLQVGDTLTFGRFEQDGNSDNGPEAIAWKVIAVEKKSIVLLSQYGLSTFQYLTDIEYSFATKLTKYVEHDIFKNAFNREERRRLKRGPHLLTAKEIGKYNLPHSLRLCQPTPDAARFTGGKVSFWWLDGHSWFNRFTSLYKRQHIVNDDGHVMDTEYYNYSDAYSVGLIRPVIVIRQEK